MSLPSSESTNKPSKKPTQKIASRAGSRKPNRDLKQLQCNLELLFEEKIGKGYCTLDSILFKCVLNDFRQLLQVEVYSLKMQINAVNLITLHYTWSENVALYLAKYSPLCQIFQTKSVVSNDHIMCNGFTAMPEPLQGHNTIVWNHVVSFSWRHLLFLYRHDSNF
jgi:hypothetical protein